MISLVQVNFYVETVSDEKSVLIGKASFATGSIFFIIFSLIMLSAVLLSKCGILVKSVYGMLIICVFLAVFTGIYRDREDLIRDLKEL